MTANIESIDESLKKIYQDITEISKRTGIQAEKLLPIMANRELVIINNQLHAIHEHLDRIENQHLPESKSKKKSKKEVA